MGKMENYDICLNTSGFIRGRMRGTSDEAGRIEIY